MLQYADDVRIDYILIQEEGIRDLECKLKRDKKYSFPYHYVSFEEFKAFSFSDSYDLIVMDPVHYKEYMDYTFKHIIPLCSGYVLLHDTLPPCEGYLTKSRRTDSGLWVGQTYISFFNFYLANKAISFNFDDGYVGYGFIDCTKKNINVDYDDSILWSLDDIKKLATPHQKFKDIFGFKS